LETGSDEVEPCYVDETLDELGNSLEMQVSQALDIFHVETFMVNRFSMAHTTELELETSMR
jgi:hypothetical protein